MSYAPKQKLLRAIPLIFYSVLIVFLYLYLSRIDFSQFGQAEFVWGYILLASLLGLSTRLWQSLVWLVILNSLGANGLYAERRQLIYIYAKSWLGRYIPGTAPWLIGKIYFASRHGISKSKLAISSLLEGGLQIAVVMAMSLIMLFSDRRLDVVNIRFKILILALLICCLIAIIPSVFNRIASLVYRIIKKHTLPSEHLASSQTVIRGSVLYAIGAIFSGLSLFFIAKAIYPELSYTNMLFVMGAGNLAGAVSMLAVFAPSGIGVREGIQLTLLSVIMPTELALLVTITTRLWGVVMDLIFFSLSKIIANSAPER